MSVNVRIGKTCLSSLNIGLLSRSSMFSFSHAVAVLKSSRVNLFLPYIKAFQGQVSLLAQLAFTKFNVNRRHSSMFRFMTIFIKRVNKALNTT